MIRALASLYSWNYPKALLKLAQDGGFRFRRYLSDYWHTLDYSTPASFKFRAPADVAMVYALRIGMYAQIAAGIWLAADGAANNLPGSWQIGTATILIAPIVWAHVLAFSLLVMKLAEPKTLGKSLLCVILENQVRRLRSRYRFQVIAVAGSVGKTSTKVAIAKVLGHSRRVRWQEGNYNDRLTVPLIFFGQPEPDILNVPAWIKLLLGNERIIRGRYPYEFVIVELGTDAPGQIGRFAYIRPDIAVITAVAPEHMEFFGSIKAVALEELSVARFAGITLVSSDDIPARYLNYPGFRTYGSDASAGYRLVGRRPHGLAGQGLTVKFADGQELDADTPLLGMQGAKVALAAVAASHLAGLSLGEVKAGLAEVSAFAGRMQVLRGIHGSTILDDSYNSSPAAAVAALDVLQSADAPQRIALLGSMNELGAYSAEAHRQVAKRCDPSRLDLVVTLGPDANEHLAPAVRKLGCRVKTFTDPYEAGHYIAHEMEDGAVILVKGSQNRVFAEESIKALLADKRDVTKLVRQTPYWLGVKRKQFTA